MFNKKLVLAVMFIVMTFATNLYAEEIWKITSLNWEPYSGAEMTNQGNAVQKLRDVLRKEGITLIVEFYPWRRAQHKATSKAYVGYFPAWPEEVADGFIASPPIDWSEVGVIKQSEHRVSFESFDDLFRKYKVGIVKTYVYPKRIDDAMKKYPDHIDKAPHEVSLLKKLSKGRHSVAITDPNVMMYLAEKLGISNIVPVDQIVIKKELVLAFRHDEENRHRMNLLKRLLKGSP